MQRHAPQLTPGNVLKQLSPADQGPMLQTLLMAAGEKAGAVLWAVAGPVLVCIDPAEQPVRPKVIALPTDLGPLRSVQPAEVAGKHVLLVGARSGVMVIDPEHVEQPTCYPAELQPTSSLGFNRVAVWDERLWACHGEAGIVAWKIDTPAKPQRIWTPADLAPKGHPATSPRNLLPLDEGQLLFSNGARLALMDRAGNVTSQPADAPSDIIATIRTDGSVIAVHAEGEVSQHNARTLQTLSVERRCGRVLAAGALPWLGSVRLLLSTEEGPIYCLGVDDPLVTQYVSSHRGLRMVSGSASRVAAVSPDRQRIVLWTTWEGRTPAGEVHLASLAKHRVADITFA
jgi:hypothetical protein